MLLHPQAALQTWGFGFCCGSFGSKCLPNLGTRLLVANQFLRVSHIGALIWKSTNTDSNGEPIWAYANDSDAPEFSVVSRVNLSIIWFYIKSILKHPAGHCFDGAAGLGFQMPGSFLCFFYILTRNFWGGLGLGDFLERVYHVNVARFVSREQQITIYGIPWRDQWKNMNTGKHFSVFYYIYSNAGIYYFPLSHPSPSMPKITPSPKLVRWVRVARQMEQIFFRRTMLL